MKKQTSMATENQQGASSVVARYYTRWYKTDLKSKPGEDHCVLQHSNSSGSSAEAELSAMISFVVGLTYSCNMDYILICVITLAESHPVLQKGRQIKSINYQISANCSRLQNKVSGKSKRGGQFLTELAPLCRITCMDGEEYTVFSCIRGRLLEVNEDILMNPSLLQEKPSTEGYIAVVLPKFEESKSVTQGLLTQTEYEDILSKRRSTTPEPCS